MLNPYIDEIFTIFSSNNANPTTELKYTDPYTLLIAVVLSAQSTDAAVNKITPQLFKEYDNPAAMIKLGIDPLKQYIKTVGLYNNKAKNIIALSQVLLDEYDGQVPTHFDALIKLPGVGRKSANVMLNSLHQLPTMPVDTHVFRVAKGLNLTTGSNPLKVEQELLQIIPAKWLYHAHNWLVLHGRYTCKARKPLCAACTVNKYCPSRTVHD